MKFAIIAAGEGSRLATEGVTQPKPLIPLCGVPMIERLIRIFHRCGAEEIISAAKVCIDDGVSATTMRNGKVGLSAINCNRC